MRKPGGFNISANWIFVLFKGYYKGDIQNVRFEAQNKAQSYPRTLANLPSSMVDGSVL